MTVYQIITVVNDIEQVYHLSVDDNLTSSLLSRLSEFDWNKNIITIRLIEQNYINPEQKGLFNEYIVEYDGVLFDPELIIAESMTKALEVLKDKKSDWAINNISLYNEKVMFV